MGKDMVMKKHIYIIMCGMLAITLASCQDWLDINTDPDTPITVTLDQALPPAIFYAAQLCYDHAEYGVYMSQALTTAGKSQTGSYPYSQGWEFLGVNRHPMWRRHFYDLGANIQKLNEMAETQGSLNYELIGRTLMLHSTIFTTDVFGDMPRSEAYLKTSPKYDSQAEVYEWLFEEADELAKLYQDPEWTNGKNALPISATTDRLYQGDMQKWAAFEKALRCRLWLRKLPNWDNTPATCQKIIQMVDEVLADPNWQEPQYYYPGGLTESNCPWGAYAPVINAWESRGNRLASSIPTTFFAYAILGCYAVPGTTVKYALDPRAEMIMSPRNDAGGTTAMRWLESNIGMDNSMKVTYYPDLFAGNGHNPYTQNTGYTPLITQEELLFIKAEAQYWSGDKAGAYETTLEAVRHNMNRYGVQQEGLSGAAKTRYERYFEVRLPGAAQFTIADLMQQKYVAMYLLPEQWTDMRRYNYSSKTNGIYYDGVPVYTVTTCHNPARQKKNAVADFNVEYSLRRPFNLYAPYWDQPDCYEDPSSKAVYSPNAWVNRLNPDTETETKYNKAELIRIGACDASGKVDYHWMQKHLIWAGFNPAVCSCSNGIEWK